MTPCVTLFRTWLLARIVEKLRSDAPPVPTTNSRMPVAGVGRPTRCLWREPLVVVVVAVEDDVGARRVELVPERGDTRSRCRARPELKRGWCQ